MTESLWQPGLFAGVTAAVLLLVGGCTLYKIAELLPAAAGRRRSLGGQEFVPDTTRDLRERRLLNVVEEMAHRLRACRCRRLRDGRRGGINAFAAGYRPGDAVIGVTRGALEYLKRDELQGVIAHEFSHILNGDMRLNMRLIGDCSSASW